MLELPILALSGMLALASAQDPAGWVNTVCFPSGQLSNTIPYPCPGIARIKAQCASQHLTEGKPSSTQLDKFRNCMCFENKIIQFEKACNGCKKTHAFLSNQAVGYWDGILDRVNQTYCHAPKPTAVYDAMWAAASSAAGPLPTGGPDDVLVNYAKDLAPNDKTKVELYWSGTTEEGPAMTATATATPSLLPSDEDDCVEEETSSSSGSVATATTVRPSTVAPAKPNPTVVKMNNDWIYVSAKEAVSRTLQTGTVRPPRPSQSGWSRHNETALSTETVHVSGLVVIIRVCQKCTYVLVGTDYKLACTTPMEVEGTRKEVSQDKAVDVMALVPKGLPKEPASVELKKKVVISNTIIQQVCECTYTGDSSGSYFGLSETSGSDGNGSSNAGSNGSSTGSSHGHGSGNDANNMNSGSGSNGSKTGSQGSGSNNGAANPASGSNGSQSGSSNEAGSSASGSHGSDAASHGHDASGAAASSRIASAGLPLPTNGANQHPVVSSASAFAGSLPTSMALMLLAAMAMLI